MLGTNSLFWVAAYLAVIKLDLVAVHLRKLTPGDVQRNAGLAGWPRSRRPPAVAAVPVRVRRARCDRDRRGPAVRRAHHWPPSATSPDQDAVLMFTSGTTARPRAVRVTHRNIRANTDSIVDYLSLRGDDRALVILPFSYCFGASLLHTHLRAGGRVVLCNSFVYPESAIDLLGAGGLHGAGRRPVLLPAPAARRAFASRPLPSLRLVQQAGGKLSPTLIEELRAAQPQARLFVMYGATEATARLSYLPPELLSDKLGSIGRGIPAVDLRVLDDRGRAVRPGERGEIFATGGRI